MVYREFEKINKPKILHTEFLIFIIHEEKLVGARESKFDFM